MVFAKKKDPDRIEGRFVTKPRAAEMLGISPRTVGQLIDAGKLDAFRPRKQVRIAVSSIEHLLQSRRVGRGATRRAEPPALEEDLLRD